MNIAFTGSHCTGKTTLLNHIRSQLFSEYKCEFVTEVARKIIKKGYPLNMEANTDSYIHYINDQLNAEKQMNLCDLFISDRTLIDPLAYALINKELPRPYIQDYFIEMMENVWLMEKERYDIYAYFPVEFPLVFDGVRPEEEKYRKDIDDMIFSLLNKHKVKFITITGTTEQRCNIIMDMFKSSL